ncbi:MAG: hypothetical protein ABIJ59_15000 [Pseudomonadota bacterium]
MIMTSLFNSKLVPMDTFKNRPEREELEAKWKNMLAHQMSFLSDFESFWKEISDVMEWRLRTTTFLLNYFHFGNSCLFL